MRTHLNGVRQLNVRSHPGLNTVRQTQRATTPERRLAAQRAISIGSRTAFDKVIVYSSIETISHRLHLHCIEIHTGITRKKNSSHPAIHEIVPHSSPPGLFHQQSHQGCSTVGFFSLADCVFTLVVCLSCMTCSSHRSMYDPDLKVRRRHSTASPSSFVRPSANCRPVGAQRVFFNGLANDLHIDG